MTNKLSWLDRAIWFMRLKDRKTSPQYYTFSIFIVSCYFIPSILSGFSNDMPGDVLIYLRISAVLLCFGLAFVDYWPIYFKEKYISLYWYFSLWFCLSFVGSYTLLTVYQDPLWVLNSALSLFLLIILVDRISYFIMSISGLLLSIALRMCSDAASANYDHIRYIIYFYVCSTLIAILFCKEKADDAYYNNELLTIFDQISVHNAAPSVTTMSTAVDTFNYIAKAITAKTKVVSSVNGDDIYISSLSSTDYDTLVRWLPQTLSHHTKNAMKFSNMLLALVGSQSDKKSGQPHSVHKIVKYTMSVIGLEPFVTISLKEDFFFHYSPALLEIVMQSLIEILNLSTFIQIDIIINGEARSITIDCKDSTSYPRSVIYNSQNTADDAIVLKFCKIALSQVNGSFAYSKNDDKSYDTFSIILG